MITMYGFWRSTAAFRVRIALNLKGLAYEERMVDIDAGEQFAPDYLATNPQGAVPAVFFDDGPPLTQSLAVLDYIEETWPEPPLMPPSPREKARVRSLALLFAADHHPLIVPRVRRYLEDVLKIGDAGRSGWVRHWLRQGLVHAEARLADDPQTGRFCHGDAPTLADLCFISHALSARFFGIDTSEFPTVTRIADACLEIDAFARAQPLRQPGAPAN